MLFIISSIFEGSLRDLVDCNVFWNTSKIHNWRHSPEDPVEPNILYTQVCETDGCGEERPYD